MKMSRLVAVVALFFLVAGVAAAQTIGIGTTPPGSFTHSSGSAVAKVVAENTGLKVRVQPMGGNPLLAIDVGDVQFGPANAFDTVFRLNGTGDYKGQGPKKNLRVATVLTPLRVGFFVRKNSPFKTIKDLKGKRVGSGFNAQKTIGRIVRAHLANAGLTYNDVRRVPAPNVVRGADDFASGKSDVMMFALGSAKVLQVSAKVGGIRALSIDDSAGAVTRMGKILPGAFPMKVMPSKRNHGVVGPTSVIAFNYLLVTSIKVPEDIVYKVVKAVHGNKKGLVSSFRGLGLFSPANMAKNLPGLEYHPGAIKFYREKGQWPPK